MVFSIIKTIYSSITNNFKVLGLYLLASFIPMMINIIINPLVALNMDPRDYSIVGYYSSFHLLFTPLITFSFASYYIKKYFEVSFQERQIIKSTILKSLLYFSFIMTIFCIVTLYIYHTQFNKDTIIQFFPYAVLSIFSIPLTGIYSLQLAEFKMQKNAKGFFILSILYGFVSTFLTLITVVWLKQGAFGKILALLLANLIFFLVIFIKNFYELRQKIHWPTVTNMLGFCLPLSLAAMLDFFVSGIDKVLLERMNDINELGFYIVGFQIAGYLGFFSSSIDDTFQPDLYKSVIERKKKDFLKIVFLKLILITSIALIFVIIAPFIIDLLTAGRYIPSTKYSRIIALSAISKSLYYAVSVVTIALGYTYISLFNRIISSFVSFFLITYLIGLWGFIGASWSIVFMYVLMAMINTFILIILNKYKKPKKII
jgi:O-antigen/teichoic acid export membrane protein